MPSDRPQGCTRIQALVCSEDLAIFAFLRFFPSAQHAGRQGAAFEGLNLRLAVAFRCGVDVKARMPAVQAKLTLLPPVFQEIKQKAEPSVQLHWSLHKMLHCNSGVRSIETLLPELEPLCWPKDAQRSIFCKCM